jgi:hypothetical protein
MRFPNCVECERLWQEYASSVTAHIRIDGKLKLAALTCLHERIPELTLQVEAAGQHRELIREEIRQHELAHPSEDVAGD